MYSYFQHYFGKMCSPANNKHIFHCRTCILAYWVCNRNIKCVANVIFNIRFLPIFCIVLSSKNIINIIYLS